MSRWIAAACVLLGPAGAATTQEASRLALSELGCREGATLTAVTPLQGTGPVATQGRLHVRGDIVSVFSESDEPVHTGRVRP